MTHRIDKNMRVPQRYPQRPWPQMEAGDSIEVIGDYGKVCSVYKSGRYYVKNHRPDLRVIMRKIEIDTYRTDTYRIWFLEREPDQ